MNLPKNMTWIFFSWIVWLYDGQKRLHWVKNLKEVREWATQIYMESILGKENCKCKGPEVGPAWYVWEITKKPLLLQKQQQGLRTRNWDLRNCRGIIPDYGRSHKDGDRYLLFEQDTLENERATLNHEAEIKGINWNVLAYWFEWPSFVQVIVRTLVFI